MSLKLNYELIYKLRHLRIDTLTNIQVGYRNAADEKARKEFEATTAAIAKAIGHRDFEITNIHCMADGVGHHVYTPNENVPRNVGRRSCIFCGCDDFEI